MFGFLVFAISNSFFAVLDLTGKPEFLIKYKIQEDKNVPVSYNPNLSVCFIPIHSTHHPTCTCICFTK